MQRYAGASSPTIRRRSTASRERGAQAVARFNSGSHRPPPGLPCGRVPRGRAAGPILAPALRCDGLGRIGLIFDRRGIVAQTSRPPTKTEPLRLLRKVKSLSRSQGDSARHRFRFRLRLSIDLRHNTTAGVSVRRLSSSPEMRYPERATANIKRPKSNIQNGVLQINPICTLYVQNYAKSTVPRI